MVGCCTDDAKSQAVQGKLCCKVCCSGRNNVEVKMAVDRKQMQIKAVVPTFFTLKHHFMNMELFIDDLLMGLHSNSLYPYDCTVCT
jgi:hypothetical protein